MECSLQAVGTGSEHRRLKPELHAFLPTLSHYRKNDAAAAVLSPGIVKERAVPPREIDLAIKRKQQFMTNPGRYTYREQVR